jgi:hypothetical protein
MREINLEELKTQFEGTSFNQLIEYHLKRQGNTEKLREAAVGTVAMLPPSLQLIAMDFIDRWNEKAYEELLWRRDTSDVFSEITEDARSLLLSLDKPIDDEKHCSIVSGHCIKLCLFRIRPASNAEVHKGEVRLVVTFAYHNHLIMGV